MGMSYIWASHVLFSSKEKHQTEARRVGMNSGVLFGMDICSPRSALGRNAPGARASGAAGRLRAPCCSFWGSCGGRMVQWVLDLLRLLLAWVRSCRSCPPSSAAASGHVSVVADGREETVLT